MNTPIKRDVLSKKHWSVENAHKQLSLQICVNEINGKACFLMQRLLEPFLVPLRRLNWSFLSSILQVLHCSATFVLFNGTECSSSPSSAGVDLVSWCPRCSGVPRAARMVERGGSRGLVLEKVLDALFQHLLGDLGLLSPNFRCSPTRCFLLPPWCVLGFLAKFLVQCPNKRSGCEGFRTRHLLFGWANFLVGTSDRLVTG